MTLLSDDAAAAVYAPPVAPSAPSRPVKPVAPKRAGQRRVSDDPIITGASARTSPGKLGAPVALAAAKAEPSPPREPRAPRAPDVAPWDHRAEAARLKRERDRELAAARAEDAARLAVRARESARWRARHA
jgi:hypothetical protein